MSIGRPKSPNGGEIFPLPHEGRAGTDAAVARRTAARQRLEDNLVQVAAGMKHFYESGEPATDEDRAREAGAVVVTSPGAGD